MKFKIIGAGLSGLMAGYMNPGSTIYERGTKRQGHQALLRMKSNDISKLTGIPFDSTNVRKAVWEDGKEHPSPTIAQRHKYSKKVTGKITDSRSISCETTHRFIPPVDFYDQLVEKVEEVCDIRWETNVDLEPIWSDTPIISTIPLPVIYEKFKCDNFPELEEMIYNNIYVSKLKIDNCNSYCTMYYPSVDSDEYRASIMGDTLIIESMDKLPLPDYYCGEVLESLGIGTGDVEVKVANKKQFYGKILDIDYYSRQKFVAEVSKMYNIYSLGRFATWRSKIVLEDAIKDVEEIQSLITYRNNNPEYKGY